MNNEVRGSCLAWLPVCIPNRHAGVRSSSSAWCRQERNQESKRQAEGKGGCQFLGNNAGELSFLKHLQLHSQYIPALVWFLDIWK